jgi:Na+/phosphate symporter
MNKSKKIGFTVVSTLLYVGMNYFVSFYLDPSSLVLNQLSVNSPSDLTNSHLLFNYLGWLVLIAYLISNLFVWTRKNKVKKRIDPFDFTKTTNEKEFNHE